MKKNLSLLSLIVCLAVWSNSAQAQCVVDTTGTTVGWTPSPLPDGCVGQPYNQVIQFVFPNDTTLPVIGTVPFTQFDVTTITNIPAGLNYVCNISNCQYVTNPPAITRGCVTISGTPTVANSAPNDSVNISALAHTSIINIPVTLNIGLHINPTPCAVANQPDLSTRLNVTVAPNPISGNSRVSFTLDNSQEVSLSIVDLNGRQIGQIQNGLMGAGYQQVNIGSDLNLAPGIYYVKFNLPSQNFSQVVKVVKF